MSGTPSATRARLPVTTAARSYPVVKKGSYEVARTLPGYDGMVVTGVPDTPPFPSRDRKGVEPGFSSALFAVLWLLALVCVITGELLPGDSAPMRWIGASHVSDKLLHFAAYTLLAFIPVFGFKIRPGILAALSVICLGVVLEFAQRLVPARSFEVADMVANTLGVLAGTVLALLVHASLPAVEQVSRPIIDP